MKLILIANLGSTSFKYRLFRAGPGEQLQELAAGGYERVQDYQACIRKMTDALRTEGILSANESIHAIGFKTILAKGVSGCVPADANVLQALADYADLAPSHNPAYIAGIRSFASELPEAKRFALFETAFYQWMPEAATTYAIPKAWRQIGIRRHGFHGASHKFIGERCAELLGNQALLQRLQYLYIHGPGDYEGPALRVISCHLGGSSSITGMVNGLACATSFGFSSQSGLPHNNRVGDLDILALPYAMRHLNLSIEEAGKQLGTQSGLLGLSTVGNDLRDIEKAAAEGHADAQLALDVLVDNIRHWVGSIALRMGGVDVIAFTGGIGENGIGVRARVLAGLETFGIVIDPDKNGQLNRGREGFFESERSRVRCCVIPANEERVIAREVLRQINPQPGE